MAGSDGNECASFWGSILYLCSTSQNLSPLTLVIPMLSGLTFTKFITISIYLSLSTLPFWPPRWDVVSPIHSNRKITFIMITDHTGSYRPQMLGSSEAARDMCHRAFSKLLAFPYPPLQVTSPSRLTMESSTLFFDEILSLFAQLELAACTYQREHADLSFVARQPAAFISSRGACRVSQRRFFSNMAHALTF